MNKHFCYTNTTAILLVLIHLLAVHNSIAEPFNIQLDTVVEHDGKFLWFHRVQRQCLTLAKTAHPVVMTLRSICRYRLLFRHVYHVCRIWAQHGRVG